MKFRELSVSTGRLWLAVAAAILPAACNAPASPGEEVETRSGAVIFNNNWKDLREFPTDLAIWKYADATAILTSGVPACEDFSTSTHCFLNRLGVSNDDSVNVCRDERFGTDVSLSRPDPADGRRGICTAFLVGDDLMLTAGHCLQANSSHDQDPGDSSREVPHCNEAELLFGFNKLTGNDVFGGTVTSLIKRNDVFGCSEILERSMTQEADFTLFRTNRPVIGHHRFRIRRSGTAPVGTNLVALGYSLGLPLKVDELGRLQVTDSSCSSSNTANCRLQGRYTSFGGGSGMPVINKADGRIEGIHNEGPQPSLLPNGTESDGTTCNVLQSCGTSGCNTSTFSLAWSVATDVKAVPNDQIPEPPGPGVRIVANFDDDILLDDLSITPQNGTFHLRINYGDDSKQAFDQDTGFAESALPPGLDLAWTLTVRDFDNDNIEDFVSQFAGFAPLYLKGGLTPTPPAVTPFGTAVNYGGFTVGDYNGDNFADLIGQNLGNGQTVRFYGSDAGLVRSVRIPDECLNDPSVRLPDRRPRALAILPIGTFGNFTPLAAFDCPGNTNSARLMFFDLLTETVVSRPSLALGGNWRALAYRRDRFDMLGLAELENEFGFEVFRLSPASGGGVDIEPVFSQFLNSDERPVGITWNEEAQEIRILIEIGGIGADGLGARLISFQENGADGAAPVEFNNCLRSVDDIRPQDTAGVVQGAGVATIGCSRQAAIGVTAWTDLLEIGSGGGVTEASRYLMGDSFLREEALQDLECDPAGGSLWGMSQSGRFVLVKPASFTTCPSIFQVSFNQLPPLNNGEWRTNSIALPVTAEGALQVNATGSSTVAGPLFAAGAQRAIGTTVDVDVFVPLAPAAPAWAGAVQLTMSTPTAMNQFIGQAELTPLSRGQWHTLRFTLPAAQQQVLARGDRDVQFSIGVNRPPSPNPLLLRNLRFGGTLTVRSTVPTDDPYASAPVFGFEDTAAWGSLQAALARETSRITQGAAALRITAAGYSEIKSRTFRTQGLAPTAKLGLDVFVPTQQPNPYWFGDINAFVSCPSAALNNAFLGNRPLTGLTKGAFHTLDFPVPANVAAALASPRSDCSVQLALNVPSGAGAYVFDNLRFR